MIPPLLLTLFFGALCFCAGVLVCAWRLARTDNRAIEFPDGIVSLVRER